MIYNSEMKKNQKRIINQKSFAKPQLPILILSITTAVLVIAVASLGYFTAYMWQVVRMENASGTTMKLLLVQAVDGLSSPAPVEATTGKMYFPQERLVLPAPPGNVNSQVEYRYNPAWEDQPAELFIVNMFGLLSAKSQIMSAPDVDNIFTEVPELQACSRGYSLVYNEITNNQNTFKFSKTLADGRQLYVYLDTACTQISEEFESYLKQIDSY